MIKKTTKICIGIAAMLLTFSVSAQRLWTPLEEARFSPSEILESNMTTENQKFFSLNIQGIKRAVSNAPKRFSGIQSRTSLQLPDSDGNLKTFTLREGTVMSEGLKRLYPNIRTYIAVGKDDATAIARISIGKDGVHAMITSKGNSPVYIDPFTKDRRNYIVYSRDNASSDPLEWSCGLEDLTENNDFIPATSELNRNADDGILRTYRLALAGNFEYSRYHIDRADPEPTTDEERREVVLSAMVTAMNRVNGVFEIDTGLTMEIIPTNDQVIFLTANDGLSNTSQAINEIQPIMDNAIGSQNYDIGHVFTTGPGGIAQLGSPCGSGKARGVTGLPNPTTDVFFIDFVAHEMGHQYGAPHVQNNINNQTQCQVSQGSSVEPGSGSTIMGYAGICPPNVQNNSDAYFNGNSIIQMVNFTRGNGDCAATTDTGNVAPVVDAGSNFTIPISTPFILTAEATDVDSNSLTYCWEQRDAQFIPVPPRSNSDNTGGPAFRSLEPVTENFRYFPALPTILSGFDGNTWEQTPSVSRTMRFRVTVRDNFPNGGASQSDINIISVSDSGGPFQITSQNVAGTTWTTQTTENITWDVAGTDAAPINTSMVDILFSADGGANFDIVIASNTPNDGSETINVPSVNTTQGRIMVKAVDNVYLDINNRNISVVGSLGVDDIQLSDLALYPNPNDGQFTVSFTAKGSEDVSISTYDVRGRLISTQSFDAGTTNFSETLDYRNLNSGMYFVTITNGTQKTTKKFTVR